MTALLQLVWRVGFIALRVVLFVILFMIAITNTDSVEFHWFVGQSVYLPLNFLIFGAFLIGILVCALALAFVRKKP
jgi:uncharacterized integral membrane protein